jgi:hypothetical protein
VTVDAQLPDDTYDVIVVDAARDGDLVRLSLTVTSGSHKGVVVTLRRPARTPTEDPIGLLGTPGRLRVTEGRPRLRLERA